MTLKMSTACDWEHLSWAGASSGTSEHKADMKINIRCNVHNGLKEADDTTRRLMEIRKKNFILQ